MNKPISNKANEFCRHPIYDKWEANRDGIVRHIVNKKDIGSVKNTGYLHITLYNGVKKIHFQKHRFIYEVFNGLITDPKLVVDHKNNIRTDNRIENLQLITQRENSKKNYSKSKNNLPIAVKATNVNSGESSDYNSIYACSKILDIDSGSLRFVLNGVTKTATSRKDKCKYTFKRI